MNKILLSLCALSLTVTTGMANASTFFKAGVGNAIASNYYKDEANSFTPGFSGRQKFGELATSNLIAAGASVGWTATARGLWGWGLEADIKKYDTTEFKYLESFSETVFPSQPNIRAKIKNDFKIGLSGMVNLANSFYVKAGPSWLNQKVDVKFQDADSLASFSKNDTVDLLGVTAGAGFTYKVTKNFGLFTEYNYSYYPSKSLDDFNITPANIPGATGTESHTKRSLHIGQSEFYVGFVWSTCLL